MFVSTNFFSLAPVGKPIVVGFLLLMHCACSKEATKTKPDPGDEVVGRYSGSLFNATAPPPVVIQVEVTKTGKHNFILRNVSAGSWPNFNFQLDTASYLIGALLAVRPYKVPAQPSSNYNIVDTSSLTLHYRTNRLSFQLRTSTPTGIWNFEGTKQ